MKSGTSEGDQQWKVYRPLRVFAFLFVVLLLMVVFGMILFHLLLHGYTAVRIYGALGPVREVVGSQEVVLISKGNYSPTARKLFTNMSKNDYGDGEPGEGNGSENNGGDDNSNGGDGSMNRIGTAAPACSKDSILIYQGATSPLPNGIPTYTVGIQNVCLTESCSISGIHLSCGWFSSARLVNPRVFRRIGYDDCLVNDGEPVNAGEVVSFQYANTFKYPLSVSSVSC